MKDGKGDGGKAAVTFDMATVDDKGTVHLSQEGRDVILALLVQWIEQAQRGEVAAKSMATGRTVAQANRQADYFFAAGSFLRAKLVSHLGNRLKIKRELGIVAGWHADTDLPPEWADALRMATDMGAVDGTAGTAGVQRGTNRVGGDRPDRVEGGHVGSGGAGTPQSAARGHGGEPPRKPHGKAAHRTRKG